MRGRAGHKEPVFELHGVEDGIEGTHDILVEMLWVDPRRPGEAITVYRFCKNRPPHIRQQQGLVKNILNFSMIISSFLQVTGNAASGVLVVVREC